MRKRGLAAESLLPTQQQPLGPPAVPSALYRIIEIIPIDLIDGIRLDG